MKEKILEAFKALGFVLDELDALGYGFQYEGNKYLYMYNENDEGFLNIVLPITMDDDEGNDMSFYQVMDKINGALKYIKAYKFHDGLWLSYERELFGDEDLEHVLYSMILHLDTSFGFLRRLMGCSDDDNDTVSDVIDMELSTDNDENVA